jgi:hypothetical protein
MRPENPEEILERLNDVAARRRARDSEAGDPEPPDADDVAPLPAVLDDDLLPRKK